LVPEQRHRQTGNSSRKRRAEAERLLHAKDEAHRQPIINLHIARAYLMVGDPEAATRSWQFVMDEIVKLKHGNTLKRRCPTRRMDLSWIALTHFKFLSSITSQSAQMGFEGIKVVGDGRLFSVNVRANLRKSSFCLDSPRAADHSGEKGNRDELKD
jgi:hypothetical protein